MIESPRQLLTAALITLGGIGGFALIGPLVFHQTGGPTPGITKISREKRKPSSGSASMPEGLATDFSEGIPEEALLRLRTWASDSPAAAAAWMESLPPGKSRDLVAEQIALAWAGADLRKATQWARSLTDADLQQLALKSVIGEMRRTDPKQALHLATSLHDGSGKDELLATVMRELVSVDRDEAIASAKAIESAAVRNRLLADIAVEWSCSDPVAAADLLLDSQDFGKTEENAVVSIVQRWAQDSPRDAATWVMNFPEPIRSTATRNLVAIWAQHDTRTVETWLSTCADGTTQDQAISAYVSVLQTKGADSARQWAEEIQDADLKRAALAGLAEAR
jgi:hypothetical protein